MRDIIRIQCIGRNKQISTKGSYLILFFRDSVFFRKINLITIKNRQYCSLKSPILPI